MIFLPVILAAHLSLQSGSVRVTFETPGPGSYQVATTQDWLRWQIRASGHVTTASHVSAHWRPVQTEFVTVSFAP